MYLANGQCQRCGAKEVIAHSGNRHLCSRCDKRLWEEASNIQKENWLKSGQVSEKNVQKNAK